MSTNTKFLTGCAVLLLAAAVPRPFFAAAQEGADSPAEGADKAGTGDQVEVLPEAGSQKLVPVFPPDTAHFIHMEAEAAVSTNFAKEPTLNYSASGYRTVQLSRYTGLRGGAPFFAELVFYVEEAGDYELWYGGTPPGPRQDVFPSYTSPFRYSVDGGEAVAVYREDTEIAGAYTPSYYWVRVGTLTLGAGVHTVRIEVTDKRRFDGRFLFYLDSVFLIDRERINLEEAPLPDVFPEDLDDRSLDEPFASINDYQWLISQNPENADLYVELSLIYSLLGDYLNALKNLGQAALLEPDNAETALLIAKNRIWKGDAAEGLRAYERLLEIDPEQRQAWTEAGKVAAWIGEYRDSVRFFRQGLVRFPDDLNLTVNLGLTYLWDSRPEEAEKMFARAREIAHMDAEKVEELGSIYLANGYPERAVQTYKDAIRDMPDHLVLYLLLEDSYTEIGRSEDAQSVHDQIRDRFIASERLDSYLDTFELRRDLKEQLIESYRLQLVENPDDLELRELLVQTYFWNGQRTRAIDEYLNILANHAYRRVLSFDERSRPLYESIDTLYAYLGHVRGIPSVAAELKSALSDRIKEHARAVRANDRFNARVERAKERGDDPPEPEGASPADLLIDAEAALADTVETVSSWLNRNQSWIEEAGMRLDQLPALVEAEKPTQEAFRKLAESSGWEWNRSRTVNELKYVAENGLVLADRILAKVNQMERRLSAALEDTSRAVSADGNDPAVAFMRDQLSLWTGADGRTPSDDSAAVSIRSVYASGAVREYAPYTESVRALIDTLRLPPEPVPGFFTDDTVARAEELAGLTDGLRSAAQAAEREISSGIGLLHGLLKQAMVRMWFQLEQDTHLIRFELGDYYLLEGRHAQAIEQFRRVLDVDQWNTSATFKLGTLFQLSGNWKKAMEQYRNVYYADPRFENAAGNYNLLARQHADDLRFSAETTMDSSRIGYRINSSFTDNFNSSLSTRVSYGSDTVRTFDAFGDEEPSWYQTHEATVLLALRAPDIRLSVEPVVGGSITTPLFNEGLPADVSATNAPAVLGLVRAEPIVGVDLSVGLTPVTVAGRYRYGRVDETWVPGRTRTISHAGTLNAVVSFAEVGVPWLENSSTRTYGSLDYRLQDGALGPNLIYGLAQELSLVLKIAEEPWTNLTVGANVLYENATDTTVSDYFTPDSVLTAKGGVGAATWLGLSGGDTLGLSARFDAGILAEGLGAPAYDGPSLQLEGQVRGELTKGDSTYFLSVFGTGTIGGETAEYWSLAVRLGMSARVPQLLAP